MDKAARKASFIERFGAKALAAARRLFTSYTISYGPVSQKAARGAYWTSAAASARAWNTYSVGRRWPASASPTAGFTLSSRVSDLAERATIFEPDFCSDPLPAPVDLAFGIESFVQATDAEALVANIAKAVAVNGYLVLCDDFLTGAEEDRWVREFRRGWRASSLLHPNAVDATAVEHGFELVEDRDLTPFLELDRPRDRALGLLIALARPFSSMSARLESHLGGNALRQCLKRGLVAYRYRVFKASGSSQ